MSEQESQISRRKFLKKCAGTAALTGISFIKPGKVFGENKESFRELIARDIAEGMSLGVVVLAARAGKILVHEKFGLARKNPEVPMRLDSIFDIASVTKVVATAAACAVCIDKGLIAVDAPLGKYLPGIEHEGRDILIRDLASHMSGFDNTKHYLPEVLKGADPVAAIKRELPVRKPGEKYHYACINLILVGFAVEAVSGLRLDEFCEKNIFKPLGMVDTRFGSFDPKDERTAKMLNVNPGIISDEPARAAKRPLGNAGLFSTATDLGRFAEMLLGGGSREGVRVLSPEVVALFERQLNKPPHHPRSFGWDLCPELRPSRLSSRAYFHTGWTGQSLYVDPGSNTCVVVLSNRTGDHDRAKIQRKEIAEAVLGSC
jgi:serine-type D-Ala-D-Ala carboxypeptidase